MLKETLSYPYGELEHGRGSHEDFPGKCLSKAPRLSEDKKTESWSRLSSLREVAHINNLV